jgi:hypothetical protein
MGGEGEIAGGGHCRLARPGSRPRGTPEHHGAIPTSAIVDPSTNARSSLRDSYHTSRPVSPAMNRRAIIICPSGARVGRFPT